MDCRREIQVYYDLLEVGCEVELPATGLTRKCYPASRGQVFLQPSLGLQGRRRITRVQRPTTGYQAGRCQSLPPSLHLNLAQAEQGYSKWPVGSDREVPMHTVSPHLASGKVVRKSRLSQTWNLGLAKEGDDEADAVTSEVCAISSAN